MPTLDLSKIPLDSFEWPQTDYELSSWDYKVVKEAIVAYALADRRAVALAVLEAAAKVCEQPGMPLSHAVDQRDLLEDVAACIRALGKDLV
jgi:hypothetical protein